VETEATAPVLTPGSEDEEQGRSAGQKYTSSHKSTTKETSYGLLPAGSPGY